MTLKYSPIWVRSVTQLAESLLVKKPGQVCWLCSVWLFSKNRGFYQWREQNVIFCNSNQKMFWFNNYVTKWLFAYSVYVDNFVSAYSVQKYYILKLYPVPRFLFSSVSMITAWWIGSQSPNGGAERQISVHTYTFGT